MPITELGNPSGAFQKTTTYVSGVDDEFQMHEYGTFYLTLRANAAVVKGAGVSWVAPTATVPVSVTPMPTASTDLDFAGVAMDAASAAGQYIRVCILGFCLVNAAALTFAAGEYLANPSATAGELVNTAAPTFDAALVTGTILGRVFGVKNATTNLALCFIKQF